MGGNWNGKRGGNRNGNGKQEGEFPQKAACSMVETRRLLVKISLTKISSGAYDDLAHEQRSTMMDFKFHLPLGHSSQHTLRLDIGIRIGYTWTINEPHLPYKTGLDVMQSHPLRRTHFGQYQASSAALGWPGDGHMPTLTNHGYCNCSSLTSRMTLGNQKSPAGLMTLGDQKSPAGLMMT